jgi:hypothetical protein
MIKLTDLFFIPLITNFNYKNEDFANLEAGEIITVRGGALTEEEAIRAAEFFLRKEGTNKEYSYILKGEFKIEPITNPDNPNNFSYEATGTGYKPREE